MPWNVIPMLPGARARVMDIKSQSKTCLQSRVDTLHANHMPLFLCPCVRWQVDGSKLRFACKAAYPSSIAGAPSGVPEWRFLVALCPLPA